MQPRVSIVAAIGKNRELGRGGGLLWHIPDDLKRFKRLTLGHPVIMGRKTWDSLPEQFRPLPGRSNIVVTRDPAILARTTLATGDVVTASSIEEALRQAAEVDKEEIFIIGGAQVYEAALHHADRLYLTLVDDTKEADAYFPPYEHLFTKKLAEEVREYEGLKYSWIDLEK